VPQQPQQKSETRERIRKTARRLFGRRGFADVTIDEIMADAGLTHGGFYKHFATKEELYAEAITQFSFDGSEAWQRAHIDPSARGPALSKMIVDAYLSKEHLDDLDGSCPMIGLPSDAARSGPAVKAAYRQILEMMAGAFEANLPADHSAKRQQALVLVAQCVGSMVLSRAVGDQMLADELRQAARDHMFSQLGLDNQTNG